MLIYVCFLQIFNKDLTEQHPTKRGEKKLSVDSSSHLGSFFYDHLDQLECVKKIEYKNVSH